MTDSEPPPGSPADPIDVAVGEGVALFAARVGNELNNPLAAVLSAHEYIRRRIESDSALAGDERVRHFLDIIEAELAAASRVVGDLVDFGTQRPVMKTTFFLRELVEEAIGGVRRVATVSLFNRVPAGQAPVHLDRDKCLRAVALVTQNAADAIPIGRKGSVELAARVDAKQIVISITDDGTGITPDVVAKMKHPLFSTKIKGTGLGLSIAEAFIRCQGGEITVDSLPGERTTFFISLPNG